MSDPARLDVYVARQRAGVLAAERADRYVFTYDAAVPAGRFVSLTMPVRLESYVWHELHPIFQMSLPEGDLLARLSSRLGKVGAGRLIDLLAFTGAELIGWVTAYPEGASPERPLDTQSFAALMTAPDTRPLFTDLVEAHLARGVSGVMPKALSVSSDKEGGRLTAFDAGGIYKTGNEEHPDLALNEWFCLRVARRAGIDVPAFALSRDRRVLRLERFDRTAAGALGFEDFAVLEGLGTAQKYGSTYERVVKTAATFVASLGRVAARREVFRRIVLCWMLRNGDAHLKNFGLLYSSATDVRLAPLYDVVTTTAYPALRNDVPALTLGGRRAWRLKKGTWTRFAQGHCAIGPAETAEVLERLAQAITDESVEVERYSKDERDAAETLGAMLEQWRVGMEDVRAGL
ncbi:MAG: type II toxin-antitoxin system HipA family toxin [Burkholderiales bacterium]